MDKIDETTNFECDQCIGCPNDDLDYYRMCMSMGFAYFVQEATIDQKAESEGANE
jgi:hypothetical protein